MLWTLALAAGAGVLMIFVPGREVTRRLFGTGILTAVAIALAMPVVKLLDIERLRRAGLFGMGVIVASYSLVLMGTWIGLLDSALEWRLWATGSTLALAGLIGGAMIALTSLHAGRIAGITGLAAAAVCLVLVSLTIWSQLIGLGSHSGELMESAFCIFPMSALAVACLVAGPSESLARTAPRVLGLIAAVAAMAMGLYGTWVSHGEATWFVQCIIIAAVAGHANLVLRVPLPDNQRWVSRGAAAGMIATGVMVSWINAVTMGFSLNGADDLIERVAAACGIVTGCATLALVVLHRFNRRAGPVSSGPAAAFETVLLACPRCKERQNAPVGTSGCRGCGLLLTVRLAEPRCPACDYITLDLRGGRCPECGAALAPRGVALPDPDALTRPATASS